MSVEAYEVKCAKCGSEQIREDYTDFFEDEAVTVFSCSECGAYSKAIYKYDKTVAVEDDE